MPAGRAAGVVRWKSWFYSWQSWMLDNLKSWRYFWYDILWMVMLDHAGESTVVLILKKQWHDIHFFWSELELNLRTEKPTSAFTEFEQVQSKISLNFHFICFFFWSRVAQSQVLYPHVIFKNSCMLVDERFKGWKSKNNPTLSTCAQDVFAEFPMHNADHGQPSCQTSSRHCPNLDRAATRALTACPLVRNQKGAIQIHQSNDFFLQNISPWSTKKIPNIP